MFGGVGYAVVVFFFDGGEVVLGYGLPGYFSEDSVEGDSGSSVVGGGLGGLFFVEVEYFCGVSFEGAVVGHCA